jgi:hypothetical protein
MGALSQKQHVAQGWYFDFDHLTFEIMAGLASFSKVFGAACNRGVILPRSGTVLWGMTLFSNVARIYRS